MADAPAAAKKYRSQPFVLVCVYQDDVSTVFIGGNIDQVKRIRNELRAKYGGLAAFHTINLNWPPARWLKWEHEMKVALGMEADDAPPVGEAA